MPSGGHIAPRRFETAAATKHAGGGISVVDLRGVVGPGETPDEAPDDDATDPERVATWSDRGGTANRDFAELTADELAEARAGAVTPGLELPANGGRGDGCADEAPASIFDARSPKACAPAAMSCACRVASGGYGHARWCSSAT